MKECCKICKFHYMSKGHVPVYMGDCRRYPRGHYEGYPLTHIDEWCGEFKEIKLSPNPAIEPEVMNATFNTNKGKNTNKTKVAP